MSDTHGRWAAAFGVLGGSGRATRCTFVVGEDARVAAAYARPEPSGHAADVLAGLGWHPT